MKNAIKLAVRRLLVIVAVAGSLLLGAATIQAAGTWTASQAPLAAPPVTVESLQGQLTAEEARGADLEARLKAVTAQASDLQAALDAANAQVATDAKTAGALQKRIAAAKTKLTDLNRKILETTRRAQQAAAVPQTVIVKRVVTAAPAAPVAPAPGDD
jgi:peptidoglycan hydrolase CwlO-like protein